MKKTIYTLFFCSSIIAMASCGSSQTDSKKMAKEENEQKFDNTNMEDDTKFAVAAADGGMLEVQLGQLAQANGSAPQVKQLGQMMVDDHSKANDELKQAAAQKNISLPATLSEKSQKTYDDLSKKTGADFDKAYASLMVDDHKEDINLFQKEADNGKDADLKTWAAGKIPTLQHHLEMAQAANDAVKK